MDIATRAVVVEGYVELSYAQRLAAGTDLAFVLSTIDGVDPIEPESETISKVDREVHKALNRVRYEITKRLAVQAGPGAVGDYCGVDDEHGRACGPELGLPDCRYHSTCPTCGLNQSSGLWWFRDHEGGRCPDAAKAVDR